MNCECIANEMFQILFLYGNSHGFMCDYVLHIETLMLCVDWILWSALCELGVGYSHVPMKYVKNKLVHNVHFSNLMIHHDEIIVMGHLL